MGAVRRVASKIKTALTSASLAVYNKVQHVIKMDGGRFGLSTEDTYLLLMYQLLTKGVVFLILVPLFARLVRFLMGTRGLVAFSVGDFTQFLLSWQGVVTVLAALIAGIIIFLLDINVFIMFFSGRREHTLGQILHEALWRLRKEGVPALFLLLIYLLMAALAVFTVRVFAGGYGIPNVVLRYLRGNRILSVLYLAVVFLVWMWLINYRFTFHYILLTSQKPLKAARQSRKLIHQHLQAFLKVFFIQALIIFLLLGTTVLLLYYGIPLLSFVRIINVYASRIITITLVAAMMGLILFELLLTVPYVFKGMTFFWAEQENFDLSRDTLADMILEDEQAQKNRKKGKFSRKRRRLSEEEQEEHCQRGLKLTALVLLTLSVIFGIAGTANFSEWFRQESDLQVAAHRAGGTLDVENSLEGLRAAISQGADWSEIDVQRSADGVYVIQHDSTFQRMAGVNKRVSEMTYADIQQLTITDSHDPRKDEDGNPLGVKVATLSQMMDEAQGKIGLLIEMKGDTADEEMADDIVAMIRERHMENNTVVMCMNYDVVRYIHKKYPDIQNGYLYYLTVGSIRSIQADYMMMEMQNATLNKVSAVHQLGKKAFVWTVDSDEAITRMLHLPLDGIITDEVGKVQDKAAHSLTQSDVQAVLHTLFQLLF